MMRDTMAKAAMVEASMPGAAYWEAIRFRQMVDIQISPCRQREGRPPLVISL